MSEIDAKRDARRRRILENSERRLQKITGRNNGHTESEDKGTTSSTTLTDTLNTQERNFEQTLNGIAAGSYERSNRRMEANNILDSEDLWNGVPPVFDVYERNNSTERNENIHGAVNKRFHTERHASHDAAQRDHSDESVTVNTRTSSSNKTLPLRFLSTRRIHYVVLAIIVNALLLLRMDHLFGKTITVPYFTVLLGRLLDLESAQDSKDGSLLVAALILCNVKPELIHAVRTFLRVVSVAVGDLALYIFSFTLMHYAISCYSHDADVQVPTDP